MPLPKGRSEWENLATEALATFLERKGAVLRAEAEAFLGERGWVHHNLRPDIAERYGPQPHHLTTAHGRLLGTVLEEDSAELNGRVVTVWVDRRGLEGRGRRTELLRLASTKRRLYRTYLSWAGNNQICGNVAERMVHASIGGLAGTRLWLPPSVRLGQVREVAGRPLTIGGPLDSAGYWAVDADNPAAGLIPFAVEVKNVRSWIYPWDNEAWDLLSKLAAFPDVVPVLVARRIHPITFNFFYDIGALGHETRSQWFTNPGTTRAELDPDAFTRITSQFGFLDASLVQDPDEAHPPLVRFFGETAYKVPGLAESTLASRSLKRWASAAPVIHHYVELRDEYLSARERGRLWGSFAKDIIDAGFYRGGWAPEDFDM